MANLDNIKVNIDISPACSFGWALVHLKAGHRVAREGWHRSGMWLELVVPDEQSRISHACICLRIPETAPMMAQCIPWTASQADMLTEDWFVDAPPAKLS